MRKYKNGWLCLASPLFLCFLLFYIVPFGYSMYYAVLDGAATRVFVGLDNFKEVLENRYFRIAVGNTLALLAAGVPVLVCSSFALALLVNSRGINQQLFQAAMILPMLLPSAAVTPLFEKLSVICGVRLSVYAVFLWKYAGLFMLVFLSARRAIAGEYYEAAALDGANALQQFKGITLPLMLPAVGFATVMGAVYNLRIFKEVFLMFGAYPDESIYLTQHYMNNQFDKLNYPLLTASGLIFALLLMALTLTGFQVMRRRGAP